MFICNLLFFCNCLQVNQARSTAAPAYGYRSTDSLAVVRHALIHPAITTKETPALRWQSVSGHEEQAPEGVERLCLESTVAGRGEGVIGAHCRCEFGQTSQWIQVWRGTVPARRFAQLSLSVRAMTTRNG